jgi:hypothetical protein
MKVSQSGKFQELFSSHEDCHRKRRPRVTSAGEDKFIIVNYTSECGPNKCFTEFK